MLHNATLRRTLHVACCMLRGLASQSDVDDPSAQDGGIKSRFTDVPFNWDEEPSKMIVHTTLQASLSASEPKRLTAFAFRQQRGGIRCP